MCSRHDGSASGLESWVSLPSMSPVQPQILTLREGLSLPTKGLYPGMVSEVPASTFEGHG